MANNVGGAIAADLAQIRAQAAALNIALPQAPYDGPETQATGSTTTGSSFAERMRQAVDGVNQQDHAAGQQMAAVDSGQSDDLVGAMLTSQQASLSFSMLMQVRNKVVTAVEDLVKLPI
ncbi:flagellar hook-basal body complex protein FliE [Pseudorhodoferax sp.]|uniref:flagellar hook-basal body complex protein FliE n=1 Tax=Pseudorhodoferax sp. TaxID=1993553 RepID=UPI002DD64EEE|nr:flagellar hook-basal body complex protein FliE [Pseudorhodoferax sp.]